METDIPIEIEWLNRRIFGDFRQFRRQDLDDMEKDIMKTQGVTLVYDYYGILLSMYNSYNGNKYGTTYWFNKHSIFERLQSKPIPNKRTYFRIQRYKDDTHRYFDYK
jgi:hypothetical protein